jgi:hemerythrin
LNAKLGNRAFNPSHETAQFLKSWLADHIVNEDTLLGAHLQNKKNDGVKSPEPA